MTTKRDKKMILLFIRVFVDEPDKQCVEMNTSVRKVRIHVSAIDPTLT